MDPEPALHPPEHALSGLKDCITEAYYNSLLLLSLAVCHLRDSARHLKAVFKLEDMEGHVKNVLDRGRELDHAANLCERYCNLESRGKIALLHEIAQSSYETLEVLRGQRSLLLDIHQELVLSKLHIVKTAAFDHFDRNSEPECHPETRATLLRDMRWVWDPEGDSIFWFQGMAGDGDLGMARMLFPTIASQLAMQLPSLAQSLKFALERESNVGEKSMEMQFEKLIFQPLQGITVGRSKLTAFILIIDALDECDPESDATTVIRLLPRLKLLSSVRLKFFVTSRPEFPILLEFDKIKGTYEELALHHVEEDVMTHDLEVYFESELTNIKSLAG
ncbi:hypothetical protein QBC32DRAFT_318671 [Pseudoneurospora amorphoporcata]|uniref:Nephrocystin 3-like N-terminal domain-containing protein n=1 Tax=Pseudoneurospora amorphoporcata TaxID=241081 RepID=A0AAN6NKM9_9PEZI|nr:hypothetical protein QBC32DRAFT_318671 [Pseudoneurospora amorphoporcata]